MRKIIICVLAVLMLTGCAKVTRREYHAEPVTVLYVSYIPAYTTVTTDGKNIRPVYHPAVYDVVVMFRGAKVDIGTAAAYELCRDKIGEGVFAVVETRIYDDDKQKQRLLEIFKTQEAAERVCKAYREGE